MGGVKDSSSAQYSCFWKHQQQANVRFHIDNSVSAQHVVEILRRDLARQYTDPWSIDFDVYDDMVSFDDPTTKLRGKLAYMGMIMTIGVIILPYMFKSDAVFELGDCELTEDSSKIRTTFSTTGTTKWGSPVIISGEDYFWFKENSSKIVRHQSTWNQSAEEVMKSIRGF